MSKYHNEREQRKKERELEEELRERKIKRTKPSGKVPYLDSKGRIIGYEDVD